MGGEQYRDSAPALMVSTGGLAVGPAGYRVDDDRAAHLRRGQQRREDDMALQLLLAAIFSALAWRRLVRRSDRS